MQAAVAASPAFAFQTVTASPQPGPLGHQPAVRAPGSSFRRQRKIADLRRLPNARETEEGLAVYSDIANQAEHIKDLWRNNVSQPPNL